MKVITDNWNASGLAPGDDRSNAEDINRAPPVRCRRGFNAGRFKIIATLGLALLALLALAACSDDSEPEDREFSLTIEDGKLTNESSTFEVKQGDTVTLLLDSDEEGSLHLHGYDVDVAVMPGMAAKLDFVASATGRFNFEFHHGEMEEHEHGEEGACQAEIPAGLPTPEISVSASPGAEAGEIEVAVELTNFVLQPAPEDTTLARGHWHLSIDGGPESMFGVTEVTVPVDTAGEHQLMVSLSDDAHCSLGITAMTKITVAEGSDHETESPEASEEEHDEEESDGVLLGAIEVYPR